MKKVTTDIAIRKNYFEDTIVLLGDFNVAGHDMNYVLRISSYGSKTNGNNVRVYFGLLDDTKREYTEQNYEYPGDKVIIDDAHLLVRTDMVELPNGVKIPRRQYEQEYATGETRTDVQEQSDFEINEFGEIIRPTRAKSQEQGQQDMVTLSNGIKIPKKQYEEEQGTRKQPKGISIGEVKASVKNSKVTTQETKSATQDIKQMKEIKKLQYMQKTGQTLTPEQKLFLDEHIRQTQQAQIQFQQRQENKKSKGKGLEM